MTKVIASFAIVAVLGLSACSNRAKELYDTAKFEELQNNKTHAVELYKEILTKYPDSAEAKEAKARLSLIETAKSAKDK